MERRFVKCMCKLTGNMFTAELTRDNGNWTVTGIRDNAGYAKDELPKELTGIFAQRLKAYNQCQKCNSNSFAGCGCPRHTKNCKKAAGNFDESCIFCYELTFKLPVPQGQKQNGFAGFFSNFPTPNGANKTPSAPGGQARPLSHYYGKWAGTSAIPNTQKDQFGNPKGSEYDLARDGAFNGHTVVILNLTYGKNDNFTPLKDALTKKGFDVKIIFGHDSSSPFTLRAILRKDRTQLWVFSSTDRCISDNVIDFIYKYYMDGHGVFILNCVMPCFEDGNRLLHRLIGSVSFAHGFTNYGDEPEIILDHLITTGIEHFYGIGDCYSRLEYQSTYSYRSFGKHNMTYGSYAADPNSPLKPLVYSYDRNIIAAYCEEGDKRLLTNGTYLDIIHLWNGTERFVTNCAAWLANVEKFG